MVAITLDHFAQLLKAILQDVRVRLLPHLIEGVWSPRRDLALHEDAVLIAVVQNTFVLRPMDARKNAIQMLHVGMIACDLFCRFRHAELGIAPRHALHPHESYSLAVQMKCTTNNLQLAHTKNRLVFVYIVFIRDQELQAVKTRMIKMPQLRLRQNSLKGGTLGLAWLDGQGAAL